MPALKSKAGCVPLVWLFARLRGKAGGIKEVSGRGCNTKQFHNSSEEALAAARSPAWRDDLFGVDSFSISFPCILAQLLSHYLRVPAARGHLHTFVSYRHVGAACNSEAIPFGRSPYLRPMTSEGRVKRWAL